MFTPFDDQSADPAIHGFLHLPAASNGDAIALTHGAGANCQSKLLVGLSDALAECGFTVLRFDLPFRFARPSGPPRPGSAGRDRQGLRRAASLLKTSGTIQARPTKHAAPTTHPAPSDSPVRVFLGGHSYGGRQASMLLAEDPGVADGLLLLSYPLHPPKKPDELRIQHFPNLTKPVLFVHGTRDPFATIPELQSALKLIPAPHALLEVEAGAHDLLPKKPAPGAFSRIASEFQFFMNRGTLTFLP